MELQRGTIEICAAFRNFKARLHMANMARGFFCKPLAPAAASSVASSETSRGVRGPTYL